MSKLISPVVFEPKLRNVEKTLPLKLSDDVPISLSVPIADFHAAGYENVTKGKVVTCDNHNALLGQRPQHGYIDYDYYYISQGVCDGIVEQDFGRVVPYLRINHFGGTPGCLVHLVTPSGGIVYQIPCMDSVEIRLNRQRVYVQMIGGAILPGGVYRLYAFK